MQAGQARRWAKRAMLLGLLIHGVGVVAVTWAMQKAFTVVASEDITNKARLLGDAVMEAESLRALTRFTSPLAWTLLVGGACVFVFTRIRRSRGAADPEGAEDTDLEDGGDAGDPEDVEDGEEHGRAGQ